MSRLTSTTRFWNRKRRASQSFFGRRRRVFAEQLEQRNLLAATPLDAAWASLHGDDLEGKNGPFAKVGSNLSVLYHEYQDFISAPTNDEDIHFEPSNPVLHVESDRVVVDLVSATSTDHESLPGQRLDVTEDPDFYDLLRQGLEVTGQWGGITSVLAPIPLIPSLAALESVHSLMATAAVANVGIVDSEGDAAERSDQARTNFGVDGTGTTVGILSDSFNTSGFFEIGAAEDVATGDLPGPGNPYGRTNAVNVLQDAFGGTIDEGRAMAQIVHDVAPGADLAFHTAVLGQASFANGIVSLATDAAADVIVDDIIYFTEPMFQDGIIAQAVDQVVDLGKSYFSSAGNADRTSYESAFEDSGVSVFGTSLHDFDPGVGVDPFQQITIGPNTSFSLSFQWDDPFASVSTSGAAAATDLDIVLLDSPSAFGNLLAFSAAGNIGGDPVEVLQFTNSTNAPITAHLAISNFFGPDPDLMKYVGFVRGSLTIDEYATNSSASWGHANAAGAQSIAAAPFFLTPEFGVSPPVVEQFSSLGGTPILFDTAGNRLTAPEVRAKPEVTGPDGGNNTFFINDTFLDADLFPNFFGTSASAPHVAGVAALMLESAGGGGTLTPEQVYSTLESTAIDMDDPFTPGFDTGFDFKTGFGLIDAEAAVAAVAVPPTNVSIEPFPLPLTAVDPLGSLIYQGSGSGDIENVGDAKTFTVDLDPGQTVTASAESDPSLQAKLELFDSANNLVASATAAAPGANVLLQTAPIIAGGTYQLVVSGVNAGLPGTPDFDQTQTELNNVFFPNVPNFQFNGTTAPGGDATLTAFSVADLGNTFESLRVEAEGLLIGDLFAAPAPDYAPRTETLPISQSDLAILAADGQIDVTVTPTPAVNDLGPTQLTLGLIYPGVAADGTGSFDLDLTLNAAIEEEGIGGSTNDDPADAQSIDSSFIPISSDRGAVLGSLSPQTLFEESQTRNGALFAPETPVFDFVGVPPSAGAGTLQVDAVLDLGAPFENLTLDIDGVTTVTIFDEPGFSDPDPRSTTIPISAADLAAAAADGTITITVTPTPAVNFDVTGNDFLTLTLSYDSALPADSEDYYRFDLDAGQPTTLVLAGDDSSTLELTDASGNVLASASAGASNVEQFILDFIAPSTGTYLARVAGTENGDYTLVVTRDTSFEIDPVEPELIVNGGFETGDFTGWTTVTTSTPFRPWQVTGAGLGNGFGIAPTSPPDGDFVAWNGFDGSGPMEFELYQDVTIPTSVTAATLSWQDRLQWNFTLGTFASLPRTLDVEIRDPVSDAVLATVSSFSTGSQGTNPTGDTGWQTHTADLSAFAGQNVRIAFVETIPQPLTGPGQAEFDQISLTFESGLGIQSIDVTESVLGHVPGGQPAVAGVVASDGSDSVTVFDAQTGDVIGTVNLPTNSLVGDVEIAPEEALAFVTDFNAQQLWVIDLSGTPKLADGINPIPVSNRAEDLALTQDQRFLIVSDGRNVQPLSVVDIATRTEITTFDPSSDHNSVDVSDDGSVLVTSFDDRNVRRLTIDVNGNLSDTGEILSINAPLNVYAAPGGKSGIVVRPRNITSFTIPGLSAVQSQLNLRTPSNFQSLIFSPDGSRIYVRSDTGDNGGFVDVFAYDPTTGDISAPPLFTIDNLDNEPCCGTNPIRVYFGIDQLALSPDGSQLFVPQNDSVEVFDALTGAPLKSITDPGFNLATGIKISELVPPTIPDGDRFTIHFDELGKTFEIETKTPAGGPGQFVNGLDPRLTLLDPSGNIVDTDDNSLDGRNSRIEFTTQAIGTYTIVVSASSPSAGEYAVDVNEKDPGFPYVDANDDGFFSPSDGDVLLDDGELNDGVFDTAVAEGPDYTVAIPGAGLRIHGPAITGFALDYAADGGVTVNTNLTATNREIILTSRTASVELDDPTLHARTLLEISAAVDIVSTDDVLRASGSDSVIRLDAGGDVLLTGTPLTAMREVDIDAGDLIAINPSAANPATVKASPNIFGKIDLAADRVDLSHAKLEANRDIIIHANTIAAVDSELKANLYAPGKINLHATDLVDLSDAHLNARVQINITSDSGAVIAPQAHIQSAAAGSSGVQIIAGTSFDANLAHVSAASLIEVISGTHVHAAGATFHAQPHYLGAVRLQANGAIDVSQASIDAIKNVDLHAGANIIAGNTVINANGHSEGTIEVEAGGEVALDGAQLKARKIVNVNAADAIFAAGSSLLAQGAVRSAVNISAGADLDLTDATIRARALIELSATGVADLTSSSIGITHLGGGDLLVTATTIEVTDAVLKAPDMLELLGTVTGIPADISSGFLLPV